MATDLSGTRALAVTANYGVEQDELVVPVEQLREHGAEVEIAAPSLDPVQTLRGDRELGREVSPTVELTGINSSGYELLLVPGGTINADQLRLNRYAVDLVTSFNETGRPIAAICHGPWLLVEADVIEGCSLTSYRSLRTDIRNAGATWVDESVAIDSSDGSVKITSRDPGDLDDFSDAIIAQLAKSR